jgi:hypothetical protein
MTGPVRIFSQAESLTAVYDGETTGAAEPYLWAFHWKVDGESLTLTIEINITSENLNSFDILDISPNFEPFVISRAGSHGNLPPVETETPGWYPRFLPWPNNPEATVTVDIPQDVGRFETNLLPIPIVFDFVLPDDLREALFVYAPEALAGSIAAGVNTVADLLRNSFGDQFDVAVSDFEEWLALPETDSCPPASAEDVEHMLEHFTAEFVTSAIGGIDGVFGSVFVVMEEDLFTEEHAEEVRLGLKDMITTLLTNIVGSISLTNLIPDPTPYQSYIGDSAAVTFGKAMFLPLIDTVGASFSTLTQPVPPAVYGTPGGDPMNMIVDFNERLNALVDGVAAVGGIIDSDDPLLVGHLETSPADFSREHTKDFTGNENDPTDPNVSNTIMPGAGNWTLHVKFGPA